MADVATSILRMGLSLVAQRMSKERAGTKRQVERTTSPQLRARIVIEMSGRVFLGGVPGDF
jgi:hypothetical protein